MSLRDLNRRHLSLIGVYATRYAVRGGAGLIFLLLVLIVGLLIAHVVIDSVETIARERARMEYGPEMDREQAIDSIMEVAKPVVSWALGESTPEEIRAGKQGDWATYLLDDRPALLSAVLLILMFAMPGLTALGAFNQYSGDVGTRGIRYQLLRTERANIYFGRYLGAVLYSVLTMALLIATIVVYMGFKLEFYGWGELIIWGLMGWLALSLVLIPYTALCGWISAMIDTPFASLVLCTLAIMGVPLVALIAGMKWDQASYVRWALPWGVQNDLLHHAGHRVALAILACGGYTAAFLALGYRYFSKRDL